MLELGSAGNVHSCWQAELQADVDVMAAPCAYHPVRPYTWVLGPP